MGGRRWGLGQQQQLLLERAAARLGEALLAIALVPLYAVSGWARRDARRVVFGGNGDRFTDNAKHLFLRMAGDDRFVCTWISGSRDVQAAVRALGLRAERRWSLRGVAEALRAGWFVYGAYPSDINFWLSRGARLLNLWHGVPLKAIEFDVDTGPLGTVYRSKPWSPVRLAFLDRFKRPDLVVSPSPFLSERCFTSAFRVDRNRCVEVGYPRTDPLFQPPPREAILQRLGLGEKVAPDGRLFGYFPTWRDDGRDFLADARFSFDELDDHLARSGSFLLFKAHPNFAALVPTGGSWRNVEIIDASVDLNDLLPACDVLVTDYSSVAFDFLLLDRPIVYFLPDHERYVGRRNLYFELEEMTAGPLVTTATALYDLVGSEIPDDHAAQRHELRRRVWGDYSGDASERLADLVAAGPSDR